MRMWKVFFISFFLIGCSGATEIKDKNFESRRDNSSRIQNTIREINDYLSEERGIQSDLLLRNASEAVLNILEDDDFDHKESQIAFLYLSEDGYSPGRLVVYWVGKTLLFEGIKIDIENREYHLAISDDYREYLSQRENDYFDGHAIFILDPDLHEKLLDLQKSNRLTSIEIELIQSLD